MRNRVHLTTWLDADAKDRFAAAARAQDMSESALLRRVVESFLVSTGANTTTMEGRVEPVARSGRISVRLRDDDLLLLRERAVARQMPTSYYVSLLVRAHLRAQTPIPTAELAAFKRAVAELGAIGRNVNQIAHAVNRGQWPHGPELEAFRAIHHALITLRDHFKAMIAANLTSWESGD